MVCCGNGGPTATEPPEDDTTFIAAPLSPVLSGSGLHNRVVRGVGPGTTTDLLSSSWSGFDPLNHLNPPSLTIGSQETINLRGSHPVKPLL